MLFVIVPFMFGKLVGIMVRATFPLNSDPGGVPEEELEFGEEPSKPKIEK